MLVSCAKLPFLLGLFSVLSAFDQGPTHVIAVTPKTANDPLYTRPQGLLSRPRLSKHPSLPPIREEAYDPLYKRPGELDGRTRGLKQPSLPRIPEEVPWGPQAQGHGHGNLPPGARNRAPFGPNHRGRG
ncbi:uncharacterized protein LOC119402567 isoform X3 [Rhipicephalus sanguineus]|uniref:uncharacterized protein LOC119402567 isoform X3 n=1 Tax=Rhipicephalus sanguineus TaxID=34632 RepID=UPI0018944426|nr:uncharacterized protein LOC119402567 isoform X3 [Rhipicephalus sanguineus]